MVRWMASTDFIMPTLLAELAEEVRGGIVQLDFITGGKNHYGRIVRLPILGVYVDDMARVDPNRHAVIVTT